MAVEVTPEVLNRLAEKLRAMGLDDTEKAILDEVLVRAGSLGDVDADVEGYAMPLAGPLEFKGTDEELQVGGQVLYAAITFGYPCVKYVKSGQPMGLWGPLEP